MKAAGDAADRPDQLDELFRQLRGQEKAAGQPPAASAYTDLRLPLEQALKRSGDDQGKILGVVVLTDGQHNWGQSPVKKAIELGQHQVPVYPVALGTRRPTPDVAPVIRHTLSRMLAAPRLPSDVPRLWVKIATCAGHGFVK